MSVIVFNLYFLVTSSSSSMILLLNFITGWSFLRHVVHMAKELIINAVIPHEPV